MARLLNRHAKVQVGGSAEELHFRVSEETYTEFPIPSLVRFCHVLFWELHCPAWAVDSCNSSPQAGGGGLPRTKLKNLYESWDGKLCTCELRDVLAGHGRHEAEDDVPGRVELEPGQHRFGLLGEDADDDVRARVLSQVQQSCFGSHFPFGILI